MTILQILEKLAGNAAGLIGLLQAVALKAPDLQPLAEEWIAKLEAAAGAENLVALATSLPAEIANIVKGNVEPADHPSDGI